MNLNERLKQIRFRPAKEDIMQPPPEAGAKRYWFLFTTHFWRLVSLNLLFLLFCIPVLTIPAAICGMNRVLINLVREGHCFMWEDFIREFKASFFKSLPFGLLFVFFLFAGLYILTASTVTEDTDVVGAAIGLLMLGSAALFSGYVFVFLPSLDIKNRHILRNAFIVMISEWKVNLLILCVRFAGAILITALFPFTIVLLLFGWFSLSNLAVCVAVNAPMQRRIIGPYDTNHS